MTPGPAVSPRWRRVALGLAAAAAVTGPVACSGGADGDPAGRSGVRGTVVVDAGCPPTVEERACPTGPLAARLEFVADDGRAPVVAVDTAPDGTFSVVLPPGSYDVRAENVTGAPEPSADPVTVEVRAGRFTELTVRFDSGVR